MFNKPFEFNSSNSEFLFVNLVLKNIQFAQISLFHILDKQNYDVSIYHDEHTYIFFHIQSLLTACGNISNVFYNNGIFNKESRVRSKHLRELLGVTKKDFPLIFQREARNTNEHFDERFDEFNGEIGDYNILDENTNSLERDKILTLPHLRTYDKDNEIYHTYGNNGKKIEYNLRDLQAELNNIFNLISGSPILREGWIN